MKSKASNSFTRDEDSDEEEEEQEHSADPTLQMKTSP
eukprot:gene28277-34143_t